MIRAIYASLFIMTFAYSAVAQDNMRVIRTSSIDRSSPIQNVFVDNENQKWVGNNLGVFQVYDIRNSEEVKAIPGKVNLLSFPDGNASIFLSVSELTETIGPLESIVTAHFDQKSKILWIGTSGNGVFQLRIEPNLSLVSQFTIENSKLRSNNINTIFIDPVGTKWIGTDEGALVGSGSDWKLEERYFDIQSFTAVGREVWILGDDLLWWVDEKGNWNPIELDQEMFEGEIIDIDFDTKGRLWMASEVVTQFDIEQDSFVVYGPVQYFTSQFVNCMDIDEEDAIWVGTEDKGLYQIEREDAITVTLLLDQPLSCDGNSKNAALSVKVVGGQEPYEFLWDQGLSGTNPAGLGAGMYKLTVTDAKGKQKLTQIEVPNPNVNATVEMQSPASAAAGNDGVAMVAVTGGVPKYKYQWDNGETKEVAKSLTEGTHKVTVTDDAGCTTVASVEVIEEILPLAVSINQIKENKCHGDENAVFEVVATGGNDPFEFNWDNPSVDIEQAVGLGAGTYTVTVTDAAGNSKTASITVDEPAAIAIDLKVKRSATTNQANGAVEAKISGGSGQYTYKWSNEESTASAEKLFAGSHSLSVTDSEGCIATASIAMTEDILPLEAEITQTTSIMCAGEKEGQISISVSGGKSPYAYKWNSGQVEPILTNIGAGEYLVTITDAGNNEVALSYLVEEPEGISVDVIIEASATTDNTDGEASVKVSGGSGKYTYKWDSNEEGKSATKLGPGIHIVTVTDGSGCQATAEFEITEDILPLAVTISESNSISCFGAADGAIEATVSGGKKPFTFEWADSQNGDERKSLAAGTYEIYVTDATGTKSSASISIAGPEAIQLQLQVIASANTNKSDGKAIVKTTGGNGKMKYAWDNGEEKETASALPPGLRTVTVTDASGCTAVGSVEITEDILPLAVSVDQTSEITCTGASTAALQATVAGGKSPFEYAWGTGVKQAEVKALVSGTYQVTVTDAAGTTSTASFDVSEPQPIELQLQVMASANTNKSDGKATVKTTGGSGKMKYAWDNGEEKETASTLAPGLRTVTVTDAAGCTAVGSVEITEDILPLAVSVDQTSEITCAGASTAGLQATVAGGKSPFEYAWTTGVNEVEVRALASGTYQVTVTDATGTTSTATFDISEPQPIELEMVVVSSANTDEKDGKGTVKVEGGAGSFKYEWSTGESKVEATTLAAGIHTLTVTDKNGCTAIGELLMTEDIMPLAVSVQQTKENLCAEDKTASVTASVSGGKGPFEISWNTSESGNTLSELASGKYTVKVTDAKGSVAENDIEIKSPSPLSAAVTIVQSANTDQQDGKAKILVEGGVGPYQYQWHTGETGNQAMKLGPGNHIVTATDANGCSMTATFKITEDILPLTCELNITQEIGCSGESDGAVEIAVGGGKGPYTYSWQGQQNSTSSASGLKAGTYEVIVTDVSGLEEKASINLVDPKPLQLSILEQRPARLETTQDGLAQIDVRGGTAPFTYAWDNGETKAQAEKLSFGAHKMTVTDANSCSASIDLIIDKKILPDLTAGMLRDGQTIKMEKLQFQADSSAIEESSTAVLNELYSFLAQNPFIVVEIGGHTNGLPPHDFCDRLSSARAKAVSQYIIDQGIDPKRVFFKGYGKRKPIATNQTPDGRRKNQRVEVKILRIEEG